MVQIGNSVECHLVRQADRGLDVQKLHETEKKMMKNRMLLVLGAGYLFLQIQFPNTCFNEFGYFVLTVFLFELLLLQLFTYGCQHSFDIERFHDVCVCTFVHGINCVLQRGIACDYDLPRSGCRFSNLGKKSNALHVWKSNVNQSYVEEFALCFLYCFLCCSYCFDVVPFVLQYCDKYLPYVLVIVNYEDSCFVVQTISPPRNVVL